MNPDCAVDLTDREANCILQAADIVTLARTGVEIDYRGDIIDAHAGNADAFASSSPRSCAELWLSECRGRTAWRLLSVRQKFNATAAAGYP